MKSFFHNNDSLMRSSFELGFRERELVIDRTRDSRKDRCRQTCLYFYCKSESDCTWMTAEEETKWPAPASRGFSSSNARLDRTVRRRRFTKGWTKLCKHVTVWVPASGSLQAPKLLPTPRLITHRFQVVGSLFNQCPTIATAAKVRLRLMSQLPAS
jgi:hypothetical protein